MVKLPVFPYIPKLRSSTPSLQAKAAPVVPVPPQVGLDGLESHVEEHIWIDLSISYVYIYYH